LERENRIDREVDQVALAFPLPGSGVGAREDPEAGGVRQHDDVEQWPPDVVDLRPGDLSLGPQGEENHAE